MIKKLEPLQRSSLTNRQRYEVLAVVRDGIKLRKKMQIVYGPKWKADEVHTDLRKKLLRDLGKREGFEIVGDVLDYYETNHLKHKKSYKADKWYIKKLRLELGLIRLRDFNLSKMRIFLQTTTNENKQSFANSTLNKLFALTRAAFNFASLEKCISYHTFLEEAAFHEKKEEVERSRVLSDEEWERLQLEIPEHFLPVVTYSFLVPVRAGEVKALRKEWIQNDRIWLPGEKTKTGKSRFLPIPPQMQDYIKNLPEKTEYIFYRHIKKGDRYLPIRHLRTDNRLLGKAFEKAEIKGFRWHDFRHTAARNLSRKGLRIELIMAIGGWRTIPSFLRYANVTDEEVRSAYQNKVVSEVVTMKTNTNELPTMNYELQKVS